MDKIYNEDLPIVTSENDCFNRKEYAYNLAESLLKSKYKSSFVVGLYGTWGSGKTSFINIMLETIKDEQYRRENFAPQQVKQVINSRRFSNDERIIIFQFNPWLCSDPNQLVMQFFRQLSTVFKINEKGFKRITQLLVDYGDILLLTKLIPEVGPFLEIVITTIREKIKNTQDIQQIKSNLVKALYEQNIKLFITIDDIDRLSEQEIVAVFQLVKALGDFPNTIYFLSFDYEIVTTALNKVHKDKGKEFLEKIVQVPIAIPSISKNQIENKLKEDIKNIFDESLNIKFDEEKFLQLVDIVIEAKYINTYRDLIRFKNNYSLKYALLKFETDPVDLFAITCLEVFEPNFFSKLYFLKYILLDFNFGIESETTEEKDVSAELNRIIKKSNVKDENAITSMLNVVFQKKQYLNSFVTMLNPKAFDRYFKLSLRDIKITTETLFKLVYMTDEVKFTNELEKFDIDTLKVFLEELLDFLVSKQKELLSKQNIVTICKGLCFYWKDYKLLSNDMYTFYGSMVAQIIEKCLLVLSEDEQYKLLFDNIFANINTHPCILKEILEVLQRSLLITNKIDTKKLQQKFIEQINSFLQSKEKLSKYADTQFVMFLDEIKNEYKDKIIELKLVEELTIPIFDWCIRLNSPENNKVSINTLKKFMTNQEALDKATQLIKTREFLNYSEEVQLKIVVLYMSLSNNIDRINENIFSFEDNKIKVKLEEIKAILQE